MKKQYYITDGTNSKCSVNTGYVAKISNKEDKKKLKKRGVIFFETFEHANNFRLAGIFVG
jgi:hypothetical protein